MLLEFIGSCPIYTKPSADMPLRRPRNDAGRSDLWLIRKEPKLGGSELCCSAVPACCYGRRTPIFSLAGRCTPMQCIHRSSSSILGMLLRDNCFYGELIGGQNKMFWWIIKKGKLIFKTKYSVRMLMLWNPANTEFQERTSFLFFIIFLFNF